MLKSQRICFIFSLFFLNSMNLFSSLLPGCFIFTGLNKRQKIEDLRPGNLVMALNESFNDNKMVAVSGLKINKNLLGRIVLIKLKSDKNVTSFLAVGENQKFCICGENDDGWISAKNLKRGSVLRGHRDSFLVVIDIRFKELENFMDSYDLSLKTDHTFYIQDSKGNLVLTHNLFGIDDLIVIGGGCLIGALIGGGTTAYKTHKNGVLSIKAVAKGAAGGFVVGGVTIAIIYYGVIAGAEYIPVIVEKTCVLLKEVVAFTGNHFEEIKNALKVVSEDGSVAIFIYAFTRETANGAYKAFDTATSYFADETARRENEDIDFSEIDLEENDQYKLVEGILLNESGQPIRDQNGGVIKIFIKVKKDD